MSFTDGERNTVLAMSAAAWRGLRRHGRQCKRIKEEYIRRLRTCKTSTQTLGVIAELFCDGSFGEPLPFPPDVDEQPDVAGVYNLMRLNWQDAKTMCLLATQAPNQPKKGD